MGMGPDVGLKGRTEDMVGSECKENGGTLRGPVATNIICVSNYQDSIINLENSAQERAEKVNQVRGSEVKIMEHTHQGDNPSNKTESQDATENSSSFGSTVSGNVDDDMSESEVMSKDSGFGEDCRMRKKRVTAHWRTFIQPYIWRCRWAELQIRRLMYQANKYDLQAEAISRRKKLVSENLTVQDTGAELLPVSSGMQTEKLMEQRKRKRVEDIIDKAAYMEHHNLFSYFGNKRPSTSEVPYNNRANLGLPMNKKINGGSMIELNDEPVSLEFRNDDDSLEQVLWKINDLQSHLNGLKTRYKNVLKENSTAIFSSDMLKLHDASACFPENSGSASLGKKLVQSSRNASQLMPNCSMHDALKSGSAISTHGDVDLLEIMKCDNQLQIVTSCEIEGDGHLIYNSTAKEMSGTEKAEIQPSEKHETPQEDETNIAEVPAEDAVAEEHPTPKLRSISKLTSPNNKRKRARRKAGRWSRRS